MASYQIDKTRWANLTIFEQMGNIGSEVGRSITAHQCKDNLRFEGALERALVLFEATIDVLTSEKSPRVREVLIARDQYLNLFFGTAPKGDDKKIEEYFMQFAVAARLHG
jgi:hypothetical protein